MFAKRSARALALLLALPSAAFALGLGDIHLHSPLNAPLDADIELVDVAADEANTVQVQLASRDTFARYGLDWPAYLSSVKVTTARASDGRQTIRLRSTDPITEPFVTLLVDVSWSRGHLVREYTMLLDPPVYAPGESAVASAPVAAPATGTGAREGSIARAAETPAAPAPAATPAPAEAATAATAPESSTAAASPAPAPAPAPTPAPGRHAHAAPAPAEPVSSESGNSHVVQRGETLSEIAGGIAGAGANTPKARTWMLAIYQANPQAFRQNMNVLRSGAVLRIPEASEAAAVSPAEATAEIRRQYAAWRGATSSAAPATAASEKAGRLKLVTPSETAPAAANVTPPGPTAPGAKGGAGSAAAQAAAASESKRLLELKNQELARMQAEAAAKQAAPAPATAPAPVPAVAPPAAATPSPAAPPPAASEQPAPAPPIEAAPAPPPVKAPPPSVKHAAAPSGRSLVDSLMSLWWVLALIALGIIAFFGVRQLKTRRSSEFDDSLGRLAAAGAETADLGTMSARDSFSAEPAPPPPPPRPVAVRTGAATPLPEAAFLVEETGSHERPRLSMTGTQPVMAPPKHVASDETISSETAINLDQGDPLAEADFHMAYGLYDQAADLIRIAISREPGRRDLKLKLLEVFFVWGNKEQFLTAARELAQSRDEAAPGEWEKILIMGKQLAPEDSLFSGGGAVTGAAAGGVDLDLEGGQSRVDFDLVGDPVPGEDGGHGLDLDIGTAVGDLEATAESQSGITDRNLTLEGTAAGTGSTRQMTARMRQGSGSTAELEGPTVEQPQIASASNPTIRQKLENAMRQGGPEHTAELAIDDLGLDMGQVDTIDQPGIASAATSTPDGPTLVAGLDDESRRIMAGAHRVAKEETGENTGAWQFDQNELEAALTQTTNLIGPDGSATSRLRALSGQGVDLDVGDATGRHHTATDVDLDVGMATGTHAAQDGGTLDLDVGTATVPDAAFAATQRLSSEDLALPDLEPVTMSEVGTKLDLARAYMDMGDPDGARNILEEVLTEGSAAQKQEAQRLIESLPG
jgi:pilus assembly protein FimV